MVINCIEVLSVFIEIIMVSHLSIYMVSYIDRFLNIEQSLHSWDKFHSVMMYYCYQSGFDRSRPDRRFGPLWFGFCDSVSGRGTVTPMRTWLRYSDHLSANQGWGSGGRKSSLHETHRLHLMDLRLPSLHSKHGHKPRPFPGDWHVDLKWLNLWFCGMYVF